jgi:hypothetical protein
VKIDAALGDQGVRASRAMLAGDPLRAQPSRALLKAVDRFEERRRAEQGR